MKRPRLLLPVTLALFVFSAASHGTPCDEIRSEIDAKIRAAGVATFSLSVVDSEAAADGQVVGSCELGTRKIVYRKGDAAAPARPDAASRKPPPILTECKDGTVSHGGDCKPQADRSPPDATIPQR